MILIGYVSCGNGHKKAAEAIGEVLEGESYELFDLLDTGPRFLKLLYSKGYNFLIRRVPFLWKVIYRFYSYDFFPKSFHTFQIIFFRNFLDYLKKKNPELIITTHFFISQLVGHFKRHADLKVKLIVVITDFEVHPIWVRFNKEEADYFLVASSFTRNILIHTYRISPLKIKNWGLPLRRGFFLKENRENLFEKYQKPPDLFTIFIFSSNFGLGPIKDIVKNTFKDFGLILIYGKNSKLKKFLQTLRDPLYLRYFEEVEEVWELMDISDLVLTKGGGLSVYEAISKNKPLIFIHHIYGQEEGNIRFVMEKGLGFYPENLKELLILLRKFKEDKKFLEKVKENFKQIKVQDCALNLRRFLGDVLKFL